MKEVAAIHSDVLMSPFLPRKIFATALGLWYLVAIRNADLLLTPAKGCLNTRGQVNGGHRGDCWKRTHLLLGANSLSSD